MEGVGKRKREGGGKKAREREVCVCVGGGGVHTSSLVNTYMYTYHVCMKAIITNTAAGELPVPYTSTAGELAVPYTI